jgi:acetyl coenzyme A synthetase (ADP forming)-like protein
MRPRPIPNPYQDAADAGGLILRDGSTATIRVARPADQAGLAEFFSRLSPESRRQRFLSLAPPNPKVVAAMCDTRDPSVCITLLVTRLGDGDDAPEKIVAAGTYAARDRTTAEVAFAVDDRLQGHGIGSQLLERLAMLAVRNGFQRFWAVTEFRNQAMIDVFHHSGFPMTEKLDSGCVELDFSVLPTEASVEISEARDRISTVASIRPFFRPNAVAVVGASREPTAIGHRILLGLVRASFNGPIYPINPNAKSLESIETYPSVRDLPGPVDLAILAVPRDAVLGVIDDCAAHGVRAVVVITAGYAEVGEEGRDLQRRLLERVRGNGMRMVGPNCLGLLNADPTVRLNASFSPVFPAAGRLAMSSQSGALGIAILALATERGLGLSTFVSVGNKADVSGNDLLQYWEADEQTGVILLYLESFGNPRRFARIARRVSRSKPIVAVKSGRTSAGKRAAGSHTAALAASEVAVDALFHQTGVIRAETLDEMFEIAATLGCQPLITGNRVAVVTNAGGPAILCTDACEAGGLTIPELSEETKTRLRSFLPSTASVSNPVDMIASAGPENYRRAIEALMNTSEVDALIIIHIPVDPADAAPVAAAIRAGVGAGRAAGANGKPVLTCLMGGERARAPLELEDERIPVYAFPESAGRVLSRIAHYGQWRREPTGLVPAFDDIRREDARRLLDGALQSRGPGWLTTEESRKLLDAFGIRQAAGGIARTAADAQAIAERIGFPVAVKIASGRVLHKTEAGGVQLNLRDRAAVGQAFEALRRVDPSADALVQEMIPNAVELLVGIAEDPAFGPLLGFGLGGIHVEILADVRFRVLPLTDKDARELIRETRGYRLLQGYRGHPPADIAAVEDVLLRVACMVEGLPQIRELDLNPVFALAPGAGCRVADVRIRIVP